MSLTFARFQIANAGKDIVAPDGRFHTDDPQVREAAIKSVEFMANPYKDGFVPLEALSWNDADDDNAYHEKLFVTDFDGTLSPELAWLSHEKEYSQEMQVLGLPLMDDNLKSGLGRWVPTMPQIVRDDAWWLDDSKDQTCRGDLR